MGIELSIKTGFRIPVQKTGHLPATGGMADAAHLKRAGVKLVEVRVLCGRPMKELYEYFKQNWNREPYPVIDHSLRINLESDGTFSFYIHPSNTGGITTDFVLNKDGKMVKRF